MMLCHLWVLQGQGLGSNDRFAQIFVDHIRYAAKDTGIPLQ